MEIDYWAEDSWAEDLAAYGSAAMWIDEFGTIGPLSWRNLFIKPSVRSKKMRKIYPESIRGIPFGRAKFIAALLESARVQPIQVREEAIAAVPTYFSRGKGRPGMRPTSGIPSSNKCNGAYEMPGHQGAREMARRVRQAARRMQA